MEQQSQKNDVVHVRFPNESYYDEVTTFKLEDFKPEREFVGEVFGWWHDTYVSIMREDYDRLTNTRD